MVKAYAADTSVILENLNNTETSLATISLETQDALVNIDLNLASFNRLVVVFNNFKKYDSDFAQFLVNKIAQGNTLSGTEIYLLRRLMTTYYKINQRFFFLSRHFLGGWKLTCLRSSRNNAFYFIRNK